MPSRAPEVKAVLTSLEPMKPRVTSLLEAEKRFRRMKNYEHLAGLVAILDGTQNAVSEEKSA